MSCYASIHGIMNLEDVFIGVAIFPTKCFVSALSKIWNLKVTILFITYYNTSFVLVILLCSYFSSHSF